LEVEFLIDCFLESFPAKGLTSDKIMTLKSAKTYSPEDLRKPRLFAPANPRLMLLLNYDLKG